MKKWLFEKATLATGYNGRKITDKNSNSHFLQGELNLEEGAHFHDRPPLEIVIRKFRTAKITAYIAGISFTALFVCIWPGSMLSIDILDLSKFSAWTILSRVWALLAASFIIIVPLVQEVT